MLLTVQKVLGEAYFLSVWQESVSSLHVEAGLEVEERVKRP